MKTTLCVKCGKTLDLSSPAHSGRPLNESVKLMVSEHATKFGCDWPAAHLEEVVKKLK